MNVEPTLVKIEWEDSNVWYGQVEKKHFPAAQMTTVGVLIPEQGLSCVVIAQDIVRVNGEVEYRNVISIPRSCILKQTFLKEKEEPTTEELGKIITDEQARRTGAGVIGLGACKN